MLHVFACCCILDGVACSIFIFKNVTIGDFPEVLQETIPGNSLLANSASNSPMNEMSKPFLLLLCP